MLAMGSLGHPEERTNSGKNLDSKIYIKEKRRHMAELFLMREVIIVGYMKMEYIKDEQELMWLRIRRMAILGRRDHLIAICPEEYIPVRRHALLPVNYVENIEKRQGWVMQKWRAFLDLGEKQIPPPLKIFRQTNLPPHAHKPQPPQSLEILPSPLPLPSVEAETLGDGQIESEGNSLEALARDDKTGKLVKCNPSGSVLRLRHHFNELVRV